MAETCEEDMDALFEKWSKMPGVIVTKSRRGARGFTKEDRRAEAAKHRRILAKDEQDVAMCRAAIEYVRVSKILILALMATITLSIDLSAAEARIRALEKAAVQDLGPVVQMAAEEEVKRHLTAEYCNRPNKLGAPSTGYWRTVRDSAESELQSGGTGTPSVTVTLRGVGLAMKLTGGTIYPSGRISSVTGKPIQFLTIPVNALAHGRTVSDFGQGVERVGGGLFKKMPGRAYGEQLFILAKQARIKADPNIWPSAQRMQTACGEAVLLLFNAVSATPAAS